MRRLLVLHPQAAADAAVLVATGLLVLGSWALLRLARAGDDHLAELPHLFDLPELPDDLTTDGFIVQTGNPT